MTSPKLQTSAEEGKSMILGFPREIKIQCLKDALEQDNFGMFMGLSKVLLDAPISEGGIETEVIEAIHKNHLRLHLVSRMLKEMKFSDELIKHQIGLLKTGYRGVDLHDSTCAIITSSKYLSI